MDSSIRVIEFREGQKYMEENCEESDGVAEDNLDKDGEGSRSCGVVWYNVGDLCFSVAVKRKYIPLFLWSKLRKHL